MKAIVNTFDHINELAGKFFAWSTFLLVILIFIDVVLRYAFKFSYIWIIELEIYLFAMTFLLASGYAFKYDSHVRVDLYYANYSPLKKAQTNFWGGLFLLLPWSAISSYVCFLYFLKSFRLGEDSPQPGGLPCIYILKLILFIGFLLLLLQAISNILKSYIEIQEIKEGIKRSRN